MKASELRIGNYVYHEVWKNDIPLGIFNIANFEAGLESIKPIPLTEEWLLRFGFELKEEFYQEGLLDTFMFHKDNIVDVEFSDNHKKLYWYDNYSSIYHQDILYVHQLQNLYFALTGEELTIK